MSNPASTYGDRFVAAVREYLTQNGLKSLGQINAKILADLAQRFHEKDTAANKTTRKLASEEEWLKELEAEPALQGIDIRRELGKCQFWCKTQQPPVKCSRQRFGNWLLKAERTVTHTYDGASSRPVPVAKPKPVLTPEKPVPGWPLILRNQVVGVPDEKVDAFCASDWHELPQQIRQLIVQSA